MPVLVVVNKVDNPTFEEGNQNGTPRPICLSSQRAAQVLGLTMIPHSSLSIVCCSATLGWGTQEILVWLNEVCAHTQKVTPVDKNIYGNGIVW